MYSRIGIRYSNQAKILRQKTTDIQLALFLKWNYFHFVGHGHSAKLFISFIQISDCCKIL